MHLPSVDIILGLSPSELVNVEPTDVNLAEMVRLHDVCAEPILFKGSDNRKVTRRGRHRRKAVVYSGTSPRYAI